jgi:hypothetical protein
MTNGEGGAMKLSASKGIAVQAIGFTQEAVSLGGQTR